MSADDKSNNVEIPDTCANCGKSEEGTNSLKACTACKLVKYCNRECQIAHRPQHKKECKKRAAELHEELLFKQPPPREDCPICFQRLPTLMSGKSYYGCCGKVICSGCNYAPVYDHEGNVITEETCSFCRTPPPISDEEWVERLNRRIDLNDANAIYSYGCFYAGGDFGLPQDDEKALELWRQAGELGHANSYYNIGNAYLNGRNVQMDMKKAKHYWELAAMQGHAIARYNLGADEGQAGNVDRALKHFMIAVRDEGNASLETIQKMYSNGLATKEVYKKALESYQAYLDEIRSDQRDKAAAAYDEYKYIE